MNTRQAIRKKFAARLAGLSRWLGLTLLVGLVFAAGALIFFARLADEMLEGDAKQFDDWVRSGIHQLASPAVTFVMRVVTMFGAPVVLFSLTFIVGLGFFAKKKYRAMILLVATVAGSSLLNEVLKISFHRTRPLPYFDIVAPNSFSFPSGHALMSFCFYSTIAALIAARTKSRTVRIIVWSLAALLIVVVGISRIYLGVHYASDVVAGYAAAFIWVMFIVIVDRAVPQKR
jgi:membrane-associated phospholipid phosphatase